MSRAVHIATPPPERASLPACAATGRRQEGIPLTANTPEMYLMRIAAVLGRELRAIIRAGTPTHGQLRDRLVGVALATLGIDLVCAVLALWFEHDAARGQVRSYGSALFWTTTQLLTVSSQFQNPLTTPGRVLDVGMEAYALTVVATLAASVGAFMIRRAHDLEQAAAHPSHGG